MTTLNTTQAGDLAIGTQFAIPTPAQPPTKPAAPVSTPSATSMEAMQATINDLARRLGDVQKAVSLKVDRDRILSGIWVTPEAVLIASDKVAVVGEVTFADWLRDVNGQASGQIDPSITTIRGGVIKTGKVMSFDAQSWIDLDAVGATPFLQSHSSVSIMANGSFTMGSASGKQLVYDSGIGSLMLGGQTLIGNSLGGTYPANALVQGTLEESARSITMNSASLFQKMSGLAGVKIGSAGIVGTNSAGSTTFAIDASTGSATFAGTVTAGGIVDVSGYVRATGNISTTVYAPGGTTTVYSAVVGMSFYGTAPNATPRIGVTGQGTDYGVYGIGAMAGVLAVAGVTGGVALAVSGKMTITDTSLVNNLNADLLDGYHAGNGNGQVAVSNGAKCTNLYADYAAGAYYLSTTAGWVSTYNGTFNASYSSDGGSTWTPIKFRFH